MMQKNFLSVMLSTTVLLVSPAYAMDDPIENTAVGFPQKNDACASKTAASDDGEMGRTFTFGGAADIDSFNSLSDDGKKSIARKLDAEALCNFAITHKAGAAIALDEVKNYLPVLIRELRGVGLVGRYFEGIYTIEECPVNNLSEFMGCTRIALSFSRILPATEDRLSLGLQAANIGPLAWFYYSYSADDINRLQTTLSEIMCTLSNKYLTDGQNKDRADVCHSIIAAATLDKHPLTFDDVRTAGRSLNAIKYYLNFPVKQYKSFIDMIITGRGMQKSVDDNKPRTHEEKCMDFDLLRSVYLHAKKDLALDKAYVLPLDVRHIMELMTPALKSESQAEMFKKYDLARIFDWEA